MQRNISLREGIEDSLYIIKVGYRDQVWKEEACHARQRTNLQSRKHKRELYYERLRRDAVVRCAQSFREGENIYFLSETDGREDSDGQAEDQDIDDPQSKGWRSG